jgi:hypothetical protein
MSEIDGHPAIDAILPDGRVNRITVCAECEKLSTILFLSGDRWYCTHCRNAGDSRPTQIPLNRPR